MITVDPSVLHTADMTDYLINADRRIVIGFRTALEALDIPIPEAAWRKPAGRRRMVDVLRAYHDENTVQAIRDRQAKLDTNRGTKPRTATEILASGIDDLMKDIPTNG